MINFKKLLRISILLVVILILVMVVINTIEYRTYTKNYNHQLNNIANSLKEKYPTLSNNEILSIIQSKDSEDNFFKHYSYDIDNTSIIKDNHQFFYISIIMEVMIILLLIGVIILLFISYHRKNKNEINKLIELIDQINQRNYQLDIADNHEGEFSILRNELYKITITLREEADHSLHDKKELKKSLEDISHQLKTPLTSILIMIDNIMDNPSLDEHTRISFIRKIKQETYNIKFLIESLLKLSKFEVNTIVFNSQQIAIDTLLQEAINNVSSLSDLKNVTIEVSGNQEEFMYCDSSWQKEAITNILKNAIEHSDENSPIEITYDVNKLYTTIQITNYGETISNDDQKHIFERFYQGDYASKDSVGIGLALSKAIVEKDNGIIDVTSNNHKTSFILKYYHWNQKS